MDLNDFRNRISEIDNQIIELFVERMRTAAKIAEEIGRASCRERVWTWV